MSDPSARTAASSGSRRLALDEPAVALSDLALVAVAAAAAALLLAERPSALQRAPVVWSWAVSYLVMAVAALAGFAYHGLGRGLSSRGRHHLWTLALASLGVVAATMLVSVALLLENLGLSLLIALLAAVRLAWYLGRLRSHRDFRHAIREYGLALAAVGLAALDLWGRGEPAAAWLFAAVLVAVSAAVIQRSGLSLPRYFDANTLYHLVQIVSLLLALQGIRLLASSPGPASC